MKELKFDPEKLNIHQFCSNLVENETMNLKYCPYKENPLDPAGCSLTNGVDADTTKSKEISNTVNSLHSLGFFLREDNNIRLTDLGIKFAKNSILKNNYDDTLREAILHNGSMIGLLGQIYLNKTNNFSTDQIFVGYPNTGNEYFNFNGERISISSGSEKDSNTRTKSCLLAWGISASFFHPIDFEAATFEKKQSYVMSSIRNKRKYILNNSNFPSYIFENTFYTKKPLDYHNLTKNTGALRENNQEKVREITLKLEPKIKNRRLAILHALQNSYKTKQNLNLSKLISSMRNYPDMFVINPDSFEEIMYEEIYIGFVAGIPFKVVNEKLKPLCGINLNELNINAPLNVIKIIDRII